MICNSSHGEKSVSSAPLQYYSWRMRIFRRLFGRSGVAASAFLPALILTRVRGCGEVLTPVTMLVVFVARKEMHREGCGGTAHGDRALAQSLPAYLPHISGLCSAAHPGWL